MWPKMDEQVGSFVTSRNDKKSQLKVRDPQNTSWARDKSSFGYRMLTQMGWNEGKGLGLNEEGRTENLPIIKKYDTKGIGDSSDPQNNWQETAQEFSTVLERLNSAYPQSEENTPKQRKKKTKEQKEKREKRNKKLKIHKIESKSRFLKRRLSKKVFSQVEFDSILGRSSNNRDNESEFEKT